MYAAFVRLYRRKTGMEESSLSSLRGLLLGKT